jgi:hypothetical protein
MFSCKRCGYSTNIKGNLSNHFQRKRVCQPILQDLPVVDLIDELINIERNISHSCEWCDKEYNHASGLSRHKKICPSKPTHENITSELETDSPTVDDEDPSTVEDLKIELNRLKNIISEQSLGTTINNNTNIDNSIDNSTNVSIVINNFGQEKIDHILSDYNFMKKCFKNLLSHGIVELMRKIHFDDEHPENQNIKFRSFKQDLIEIFNGNRWNTVPGTQTTEDIARRGCVLLSGFYDEILKDEMDDDEMDDRYRNKIRTITSKTGNDYYAVRKKARTMLLDESERLKAKLNQTQ